MSLYSFPKHKKYINIILFIFFIFIVSAASFVSAQEAYQDTTINRGYIEYKRIPETRKGTVIFKSGSYGESARRTSWPEEENLSELQKQARFYRNQALELQRIGNIDAAMSLYQKAVELDPLYAVAYNDLGVVYEAKGFLERAEESYKKCINIDPNYLSVYSNLALLYENKRDLNKAAFYWKKRAALGSADDPWTQKAKQRLKDIQMVYGYRGWHEEEVIDLIKDVAHQKSLLRQDDNMLSSEHFEKAKQSYAKEDYATAIKEALDAQQLDPNNKEIEAFIEKVQLRALSR